MKKAVTLVLMALMAGTISCASTQQAGKQEETGADSGAGVSLLEAIEQSAEKIVEELPKGSRVAIVAFESENDNLSEFIMEELTGALVDLGMEVADRQNLEFLAKEFNLQMSGAVNDDEVKAAGNFMAADMVITGQIQDLGRTYRYRTNAVHMEQAKRASVTRLSVRNDAEMQEMAAKLAKQQTKVKTATYGVSEKTAPKTAGTFLDRGMMFANRGEYEMAIEDFTAALGINPDLAAAYALRGYILYLSASKIASAGDRIDNISTYARRKDEKITAEQTGAYDRAIADFTQAIKLNPQSTTYYLRRGNAYHDKGDYDKAIADYSQAIRLNPNGAIAYSNRGSAYHNKDDFDKAIADYNQAIRLNPNYANAYNNRGNAYKVKGDQDRAIADYDQVIRLNPNDANAYNNRGNAHFNKGDLDKAIADFNQAIRLNPNYADAYYNRGNAHFNKGDLDKAIADYNQVIRLNPNYANAYNNRGSAYFNKGDLDKAIADYEAALRIDPNHANAKKNLDIARQKRGR